MYFPWLGQLNQALLADAFVFYSDVQFSRGFINRVQVIINGRQQFITVPTIGSKRSLIKDLKIDETTNWRNKHLLKLKDSFTESKYCSRTLEIFKEIVYADHKNLADLSSASVKNLCKLTFPDRCPKFYDSRDFPRDLKSTASLIYICKELGATKYLTGHGASKYISVNEFENNGIELEFIDYDVGVYNQFGGEYITPYVTVLDAISHIPLKEIEGLLNSKPINHKIFLN